MSLPERDAVYIETVARQVGELYAERGLPGAAGIPAMVEDALHDIVWRAEGNAAADALDVVDRQMYLLDEL